MKRKISRSRVRELHEQGLFDHEIAEKLNCSHSTIWMIRNRELGLKATRPNLKTIDHDELWKDYRSGMSLDELAEKYHYKSVPSIKRTIGRIYQKKRRGLHERK